MLYEIINPSDAYTIEAASLDVAFVACVFLGRGLYSFQPIDVGEDADGEPEVTKVAAEEIPLFLFGGTEEWCKQHLNESFESVVDRVTKDKATELAACFESCLIGKATDRDTYLAGLKLIEDPHNREEWRRRWHDKRRSSMNDIGGRAYLMAKRLREGASNPLVPAPQQVFTGM